MRSTLPIAAKCLNSLLRYELAAVRAYRFAESVCPLPSDRDSLAAIRRDHESIARTLRESAAGLGEPEVDEVGLWGMLNTLVEASAGTLGRRSMLTVLLWSEQHAAQTYQSAARIPGLGEVTEVVIPAEVMPALAEHIVELEKMIAGFADDGRSPCSAVGQIQFAG
jgi:hypothetical protein